MTANVTLQTLTHYFGAFKALDDINLDFAAGEFVVLLGPSGCGKSTLLFILGGFLTPTEGQVLIGGKDMSRVAAKDRPTTTMFQDYALFPHMTLRDNVAFGLRMRGQPKRQRHAKAEELLDLVGLSDKAGRKPHELSGGQRQRVALARALAVEPKVLLLDEPLGALDLKLRRQMQEELKAIQRKVGTTFVHVTHDQEEAMAIADRIAVMNHGRVEHVGTPEEVYLRPKTLFSANFMGDLNMIPEARMGFSIGENKVHAVRPENIGPAGEISLGEARMTQASFFGTYHRCYFQPADPKEPAYVAHLPVDGLPQKGVPIPLYASNPLILEGEP